MALSNRMNENAQKNNSVMGKGNARTFKLNERVKFWSNVRGVGDGMSNLDEATQRNLAQFLDNEAGHMSKLTETQISTSFNGFTPENMLRLVRLAMPNVVRSKIFTEFAMETARDSIKYIRPVYSKTQNGKGLPDRADDETYTRIYEDADEENDINNENYRRAIYETTADRMNQELATVKGTADGDKVTFAFVAPKAADIDAAKDALKAATSEADLKEKKAALDALLAQTKWGVLGEKYLEGYGVVYYKSEKDVIAIQDKRTKKFYISGEWADKVVKVEDVKAEKAHSIVVTLKDGVASGVGSAAIDANLIMAYARFDSETDFTGDYLGEVEIKMSDYEFRPRPTTIGVTWSQMSELTLDTSFNVSAEEYLVTYAASAIKQELDYRAIRTAYMVASTNPKAYNIHFDAAYNTNNVVGDKVGTKEGYRDNAQTFLSAIGTIGDVMYNDIKRGGVSRIVCGPSAGTYFRLITQFTNKGAMPAEGAHQIGELDGIPTFKVPDEIIPTNKVLTVWKNPSNEADIAIAFGTFVPFFSTGVIQRKNFYKEAGLATYGDWAVLNRRYMATITIDNLKDTTEVLA